MINQRQFEAWAKERNINLLSSMKGFNKGDSITFTNEYGVSFPNMIIAGFTKDSGLIDRHVYLLKEAYWFPVKLSEIKLTKTK